MRRILYVGLFVALLVGMTPYSVQAQTLPEPDPPIGSPGGQGGELPWARMYIPMLLNQQVSRSISITRAYIYVEDCAGPLANHAIKLLYLPANVTKIGYTNEHGDYFGQGPASTTVTYFADDGNAWVMTVNSAGLVGASHNYCPGSDN